MRNAGQDESTHLGRLASLRRRVEELAVGGGSALLWAEERSLPAFAAVTSLRLARRNQLQALPRAGPRCTAALPAPAPFLCAEAISSDESSCGSPAARWRCFPDRALYCFQAPAAVPLRRCRFPGGQV